MNEQIAAVFAVCALCPQHTFLILTKWVYRAIKWCKWSVNYFEGMNTIAKSGVLSEYIEKIITERWLKTNAGAHYQKPFPDNVWFGVSVEDQKTADERIPLLYNIQATKRFVSFEPLLGPVKRKITSPHSTQWYPDWIIVGAETGPHKRPMNIDWARSIRDQYIELNVPFFFNKDSFGQHELDGQIWEQFPK